MKPLLCSPLLLFAFSLSAQAPVAVPVANEPHHHLVFENSYVRVFRVSVPAHDATLLHQHDLPYVYVSLGPADVINAVAGKPEARLVMTDGQVGYSRGGFAHVARTDAGSPFDNVTVELLHPQGEPRNICTKVIDGPVMDCSGPPINRIPNFPDRGLPLFETGEVFVNEVNVPNGPNHLEMKGGPDVLLVVLANPGLSIHLADQRSTNITAGGVLWLPVGKKCSVSAARGVSLHFLLIAFNDGSAIAKP
jgi:hypothetical protein